METSVPFDTGNLRRRAAAAAGLYAEFINGYRGRLEKPSAEQLIRESGIPPCLVDRWTFESFDPESETQKLALETLESVVRKWKTAPRSVFIHGAATRDGLSGNGVGKSHLLVAAAVQMMRQYQAQVCYRRMVDLIAQQIAWYRDKEARMCPFLVARDAEVLALDDVDKGSFDPREQEGLYRDLFGMLDYRFDSRRPTLITSNYTPDEIRSWLGASVGSRLSHALEIVINGRDGRSDAGRPFRSARQ